MTGLGMFNVNRVKQLNEDEIDPTTRLVCSSFFKFNDIWKSQSPTEEDVYPALKLKISTGIRSGWSYVNTFMPDSYCYNVQALVDSNKQIAAAFIQLDMVDYLSTPTPALGSNLFNFLGKYGGQVQKSLKSSPFQPGEAMYCMYCAIQPTLKSKGLCLKFWWFSMSMAKASGYRYLYSRASNPVSHHIFRKLGAVDVDSVTVEKCPPPNNRMVLIKIDLDNLPTLEQLIKPPASEKQDPRPRL